jgi:hypothetical protein
MGSKTSWLESSGAHKAAEALGSTCIGAWASWSHSSCYRHGGPKSADSENPEAYLLVLGYLEPRQLCRRGGIKPSGNRSSGA